MIQVFIYVVEVTKTCINSRHKTTHLSTSSDLNKFTVHETQNMPSQLIIVQLSGLPKVPKGQLIGRLELEQNCKLEGLHCDRVGFLQIVGHLDITSGEVMEPGELPTVELFPVEGFKLE